MSIPSMNIKRLPLLISLILFSVFSTAITEAPIIQTPAPVIHLADNLDEKDNLGWCIDTVGRGFAETLGDVQFLYNKESLNIQSATFENKCVTISDLTSDLTQEENQVSFMLLDCAEDDTRQQITYNEEAQNFHPKDNLDLCISVGESSRLHYFTI